jgi:hypothetical protein
LPLSAQEEGQARPPQLPGKSGKSRRAPGPNAGDVSLESVIAPRKVSKGPIQGDALFGCSPPTPLDCGIGVDRGIDLDRQRLAGELADDVEELQLAVV